uniref:hypothetical protein n=1 Tax=Massilia sp. S19_KUP03_FR1 TaxID=3025503 RepID=UPI002FCDCCE6
MIEQFDGFSWHDNAIHGFRIAEGPDGCGGQLTLDIDFIVQWLPPSADESAFAFVLAPADLVFHEVTDLVFSIDYASCSASLQPMMIHEIRREVFTYPNGQFAFSWRIDINWPRNSFISFHSPLMSQTLRGHSISSGAQYLTVATRGIMYPSAVGHSSRPGTFCVHC